MKTRLKLSYVLPAILMFIGLVVFSRSISLYTDMTRLVAGRKSFDAEIINRMIGQTSTPQITEPEQQLSVINRLLQHSHRSTRILVSDKVGSYLVDNSQSLKDDVVPDRIVKNVLLRWQNGDPNLFGEGIDFHQDGNNYHAVGKVFYLNVRLYVEKRYTILITNLDNSIEKAYPASVANLIVSGIILGFGVILAIVPVIVPLRKMGATIGKGKQISIGGWWAAEIANLAEQYNRFLVDEAVARTQIEQSYSGQMLVFAEPNKDAIIKSCNESLTRVTGYLIEELIDKPLNQICPEYSWPYHDGTGLWSDKHDRYLGAAQYAQGCPFHGKQKSDLIDTNRSVELTAKDGAIKKCDLGVTYLGDYLFAGTLTDNTKLLESIELSNKVIDGIPDSLIFVKGHDRKYLLANKGMTDLVGYDILGLTDMDIWPDDAPEYNRNDDDAIEHGSQINRLEQITKNGKRAWLSSSKIVLHVNGSPSVLGVSIDVTELINAKDELDQLYRSLRHDIISNIKGIIDSLDLLSATGFKPEMEYLGMFDLLASKARVAYQLVNNTGKLGESLKIENVRAQEMFDMMRSIFALENVVVNCPSEDIFIAIDKNAFALKVLSNLIGNAIKYSPPSSEVVLGIKDKGDSVVMFVQDRGRGLDADEINTILNNYGSLARLQPEIEGTGTGLHTAQQILKQLGLYLEVRSSKGSGSLFYVKIPKVQSGHD